MFLFLINIDKNFSTAEHLSNEEYLINSYNKTECKQRSEGLTLGANLSDVVEAWPTAIGCLY